LASLARNECSGGRRAKRELCFKPSAPGPPPLPSFLKNKKSPVNFIDHKNKEENKPPKFGNIYESYFLFLQPFVHNKRFFYFSPKAGMLFEVVKSEILRRFLHGVFGYSADFGGG
jgi:hypothetical protein